MMVKLLTSTVCDGHPIWGYLVLLLQKEGEEKEERTRWQKGQKFKNTRAHKAMDLLKH